MYISPHLLLTHAVPLILNDWWDTAKKMTAEVASGIFTLFAGCDCALEDILFTEDICNEECAKKGLDQSIFYTCSQDVLSVPEVVDCKYQGDIILEAGKVWHEANRTLSAENRAQYEMQFQSTATGTVTISVWGNAPEVACATAKLTAYPVDVLVIDACGHVQHYREVKFSKAYDSGVTTDEGKVTHVLTGTYAGSTPPYYYGAY